MCELQTAVEEHTTLRVQKIPSTRLFGAMSAWTSDAWYCSLMLGWWYLYTCSTLGDTYRRVNTHSWMY